MKKANRIGVLEGGNSAEADVSRSSAAQIIEALKAQGYGRGGGPYLHGKRQGRLAGPGGDSKSLVGVPEGGSRPGRPVQQDGQQVEAALQEEQGLPAIQADQTNIMYMVN